MPRRPRASRAQPAADLPAEQQAKIVVAGRDFGPYLRKGDVISVVPPGEDYGSSEVPPDFVRLTVTDASTDKVLNYLYNWPLDYTFTELVEDPQGWRYEVTVNPDYISLSGKGRDQLKIEMVEHCEGGSEYWEGCIVQNFTVESMTVDIPKNGPYQSSRGLSDADYLKLLKSDFSDIFRSIMDFRRYYIRSAAVDEALQKPNGQTNATQAEALTQTKDRLEE